MNHNASHSPRRGELIFYNRYRWVRWCFPPATVIRAFGASRKRQRTGAPMYKPLPSSWKDKHAAKRGAKSQQPPKAGH